jgi:predicted aldo/keto reductase-like oxidoreductase
MAFPNGDCALSSNTPANDAQKDYSTILANAPKHAFYGHCMYCGHCAPCAEKIDIAAVNKYLDLALIQKSVPETLRDHYGLLEHHADECIACEQCMKNCPFGVDVISKMRHAAALFEK